MDTAIFLYYLQSISFVFSSYLFWRKLNSFRGTANQIQYSLQISAAAFSIASKQFKMSINLLLRPLSLSQRMVYTNGDIL